jgi:hypothetical protein
MAQENNMNNPSAFACAATAGLTQTGMTLRDYFAGQYLAAGSMHTSYLDAADNAYKHADAMLEIRAK